MARSARSSGLINTRAPPVVKRAGLESGVVSTPNSSELRMVHLYVLRVIDQHWHIRHARASGRYLQGCQLQATCVCTV